MQSRSSDIVSLGLGHIKIVAISVAIATIVGVGLGVLTYRTDRPREIALAITSAFLTIPSYALFVLLIPVLGLGSKPVVLALVLYGIMPVLRNTVTGLREVDPAVVESAQGMGMGRWQRLLRIEMPLAWPVIITGVRVTTLVLIGIATIGTIVLGPGYGDFIFTGIDRVGTPVAVPLVVTGMVGVIIVAIIFDLAFQILRVLTTSKGIR